jgi:ATP-binding cassette, subfamily B, bacterial MsbA
MKFDELISILRRLYEEYVRKHFGTIFLSLFLSLLVAASTSAIAYLLDPAVKKIFIEKDKTLAWLIPVAIIIVFTTKGASLYFARLILIRMSQSITAEIQGKVAEKILRSDIETLDNRHSGKYIANIQYDAYQVQQLVSTGVLNIMKDTLTGSALIGVMFYQNWKLAIFAVFMMPLAVFFVRSLGKRMGKAVGQAGDMAAKVTEYLSEIFKAAKIIRIYQKEREESEKIRKMLDELRDKNTKITSVLIRSTPIMETLTGFMIAGFIYYSGILITREELDVASFFSFLAAMMLAYQPVRSLATINMLAHQGAVAYKRITTIIDQPASVKNESQLPDLKLSNCDMRFKDVSFKYSTTKDKAIKNINLDIQGGTMTAFVGHSGAGKSTIINLLPRFYDPNEGDISIDSQNIKNINLNSLRKNLSLVSQDVILFDDTIKNNIAYANDKASEDEVVEASKFAAADEFIDRLPNKYDTFVGENGVRLSGGQKQRISIARAILKKSPIILLDEATSSLDAESEEIVQNAIKNLIKNKTTLVIAHRLSTIHNARKIVVLKQGEIIDSGNHEQLITSCKEYKSLYEKQLK